MQLHKHQSFNLFVSLYSQLLPEGSKKKEYVQAHLIKKLYGKPSFAGCDQELKYIKHISNHNFNHIFSNLGFKAVLLVKLLLLFSIGILLIFNSVSSISIVVSPGTLLTPALQVLN